MCDWVVDNELPIRLVENILDANLTVINVIKTNLNYYKQRVVCNALIHFCVDHAY